MATENTPSDYAVERYARGGGPAVPQQHHPLVPDVLPCQHQTLQHIAPVSTRVLFVVTDKQDSQLQLHVLSGLLLVQVENRTAGGRGQLTRGGLLDGERELVLPLDLEQLYANFLARGDVIIDILHVAMRQL